MANCSDITEQITLYVDEMLDDATEKAAFEAHIASCADCRAEYEAIRDMLGALKTLPELPLPEGFHEKMMEGVRAAAQPTLSTKTAKTARVVSFPSLRWRSYASAAAGVLVALFGISAVTASLKGLSTPTQNANASNTPAYNAGSVAPGIMQAYAIETVPEPDSVAQAEGFVSINAALVMTDMAVGRAGGGEAIVKNYNLVVTADNFDEALAYVKSYSGTLLSSEIYSYDETAYNGAYRVANLRKAIPGAQFDAAIDAFRALGTVEQENQSQYSVLYDLADSEARLAAKQVEYERLMELFNKADTVEKMLMLDARIQNVIYEMDSYQSHIQACSADAAAPYITLQLMEEPPAPQIEVTEPLTFAARVANSFTSSVNGTAAFLEWFIVAVSGSLVPLALIGIAAIGVFAIAKKRRRGERHEAK